MPAFIDLTGQRFGKLVVDQYLGKSTWQCTCDCGRKSTVNGQRLREGQKSCGCAIGEANSLRSRHGMYKSRAYNIWQAIRQRCENPNEARFHRYGGRGITVCERWQKFENFYADMGDPPKGTSIDRIDNDGDYEPSNCRWATPRQQSNNTSTNTHVTHSGKTQTLAQWAAELGIPYSRIVYRHAHGWTPPELFNDDNLKGKTVKHLVEYEGETITLKEASQRSGVPMQTLYWRMRVGKDLF